MEFFKKLSIRENYYNWIESRKNVMMKRIKDLKENTLFHYYTFVREKSFDNWRNDKFLISEKIPFNVLRNTFSSFPRIINNKDENIDNENNENKENNDLLYITDRNFNKKNSKENFQDKEKNNIKSRNKNYSEAFTIDSSNFLSERKKLNLKKFFNQKDHKMTLNIESFNKKQYKLKFGKFPINKKLVPRLKLYNNVIDKLIKEQKKICDDSKRNKIDNSLKKIDILSFDKYIEQNKSERHFLNKPNNIKFRSNYYEYINSEKYFPNSLRLKSKNKKVRYLSDEGISPYSNRKIE
jgi:hypothetical protein